MNTTTTRNSKLGNLPGKGWLLALAPAVIVAWLMTDRLGAPAPDVPDERLLIPAGERYEGFGRGIRSAIYGEDGLLAYSLSAEAQRLYPDQLTELDAPLIRMYEENQERWNISAISGRIQASSGGDIRQIDLNEAVQVRHQLTEDDSVNLTTDWLIVQPEQSRLYTDAVVNVSGLRIEQTAVGLTADFSLDSLEFLSDVQGRFFRATD
tara:strand:- start:56646 stop:57269 length:624 start_codon:yes stop_codon:yes gene_type:complete